MNNNECEDGNEESLWGAIKSTAKMVNCCLVAGATEVIKNAEESIKSGSILLVESLKITYSDGSRIEDPELAMLIKSVCVQDDDINFKELDEIARVYSLDIENFLYKNKTYQDFRRYVDNS